MSKPLGQAVIVAVFTAVAAVFASIVLTTLRSPVTSETVTYTATFSDVSGLFVGNDVRIAGVQVGKVETIRLDGRNADVEFSALKSQPLSLDVVAAVRYQNLLGQRYLELVQPAAPGSPIAPGASIPLERTIPSFDISKLFNGFRPFLQALDPAQFNQFGEDLLRLVQGDGDGSGIGPVLRDLDAISKIAVDHQAVFVRFIHNLGDLSAELGGKSKQVVGMVEAFHQVLTEVIPQLNDMSKALDVGNRALGTVASLTGYLEHLVDVMTIPYYDFMMRVLPHTPAIVGALSMLPSLFQGLRDQTLDEPGKKPSFPCSNGVAALPGVGEVPFGDQNLVLCQ